MDLYRVWDRVTPSTPTRSAASKRQPKNTGATLHNSRRQRSHWTCRRVSQGDGCVQADKGKKLKEAERKEKGYRRRGMEKSPGDRVRRPQSSQNRLGTLRPEYY